MACQPTTIEERLGRDKREEEVVSYTIISPQRKRERERGGEGGEERERERERVSVCVCVCV